jgi:ubiquinone/menaquinone biosynthesis C-methylase UbiE
MTMGGNAKEGLQKKIDAFLMKTGLAQGQTVLDFGCNEGSYTIPAACIVGESGTVYALDKNEDSLEGLMREVRKQRLRNVKPLHVEEGRDIPLGSGCVDVVLLYDTLHGGYFPETAQRSAALRRIHRILKPGGLLSCYPTHLRQYGITLGRIVKEITAAGFRFQDRHCRTLVHDGKLVRGTVLCFTKSQGPEQAGGATH